MPPILPPSRPTLQCQMNQDGDEPVREQTEGVPQAPKKKSVMLPWIEKYRPRILSDVVGNEDAIRRLTNIGTHGNLPNLILCGPPGTGKTTSVVCLARHLLNVNGTLSEKEQDDIMKKCVLELNASDDRGLDVVREKIKFFAQRKVNLPANRHKIVILDEADSMSTGAQQALRRTMELFSHSTRFCLACNISSKIIEPIQSRCAILRFQQLSDAQLRKRLLEVLKLEGISSFTEKGIQAILFTARGDMRIALNVAQATTSGLGSITEENVFKVADQPSPVVLQNMVMMCVREQLQGALQNLHGLLAHGYAPSDVVGTLFSVIKKMHALPQQVQMAFIKQLGFVNMRIAEGETSPVQLSALLARFCVVSATLKKEGLVKSL